MRGALAILAAGVFAAVLGVVPVRASHALARADERRAGARIAPKSADYDAPTERWREGPVRYLLTGEEDEAYHLLSTEADRAAFIQKFWASRDPVASTPDNEYRGRFYARVVEANSLFADSTKPGWKTDRGKIFILLGPPDDLEQEQTRDDFVPNVVVWTYRHPPGGENMNALPVVRFVRDATGEFRLSNDVFVPGFETKSGITFQIQAMQMKSLPQQKTLLDTIVSARTLFDSGPFRTHGDFFRARDGNTLTILTLGVKTDLLAVRPAGPTDAAVAGKAASGNTGPAQERPADERFEVVARLVGASPDLPSYDFAGPYGLRSGASGPVLDSSGYLMFQGALPVRPGMYTAYYAVVDHHDGGVYSHRGSVAVPDLRTEQFRLSRITLASLLERVEGSILLIKQM